MARYLKREIFYFKMGRGHVWSFLPHKRDKDGRVA